MSAGMAARWFEMKRNGFEHDVYDQTGNLSRESDDQLRDIIGTYATQQ